MKKRVTKASKWYRLGFLIIIVLIIGCVQFVFADGEYTIYNASESENGEDEYHATTATSQSDYAPDSDPLVYCINMHYLRPQPSSAGISGYTKISQASDDQINSDLVANNNDQAKYIRAVLYYGYPNFGNNNEWKTTYESNTGLDFPTTAYYWRIYTQAAIWYYTDDYSSAIGQNPGSTLRELAYQNVDSIPDDYNVDLYTKDDGTAQNFIGLEATETSTTTSVNVQVNKSWELSTGGTYDGTLPDVTFSLYEGDDTTGDPVYTQTLGDDGTVTFNDVDTTSTTTYTLVEDISGSVDGYTFTAAENQTLDLSETTDGGTYEVDVTNTVTEDSDITSVNVQINKTWVLSTGGTYNGAKPSASFTLYEGEGTSGTAYGPVTIGDDGTATFSGVDTTTEKTFTLVENISGAVSGYTFTPVDNQTIDLSDVADGDTYVVDVENTVTSKDKISSDTSDESDKAGDSDKSDQPKTGDETNMGLDLAIIIAAVIGVVVLRKHMAK